MYIVTLKQGKAVITVIAFISATVAYNTIGQWLDYDSAGILGHKAKIKFVPASDVGGKVTVS